jgi:hypothetical protein
MLNNEVNFILNDMQTYFEFDKSNFVSNAAASLTNHNEVNDITVDLSVYRNMVLEAVENLNNMHESARSERDQMIEFFSYSIDDDMDDINVPIEPICAFDVSTIKPQYLNDFVTNIGLIIERTLKGDDNKNDIDRIISTDMAEKVKRQIVKTTIVSSYMYDVKKLAQIDYPQNKGTVYGDSGYIINNIIPFLKNIDTTINVLRTDANNCIIALDKCIKEIDIYRTTLKNIKETENLSPETIKRLNYVTYNAFRSLIDVVSFMSYMLIRKINEYMMNIKSCTSLYVRLSNSSPVSEGTLETNTIFSSDTHNLCDDLINGRSDAYDAIANNIYEFNTGLLMNSPESPMAILGKDASNSIEATIEEAEYNSDKYEDANKMYTIINKGLDIVSQYSDDYLMVFDDITSKAGFELELPDRFKSTVDTLDDITEYTSAINLPTYSEYIYYKMLHEIRDYPKNMNTLASVISDCKARIDMLTDRFNHNIQGEYSNAEAVNELKIFMEEMNEQLVKLTNQVAGKFMLRLKKIGLAIEQMNVIRDKNNDAISTDGTFESVSFDDGISEAVILAYESYVDAVFEEMSKRYLSAKAMKDKGSILVFEDGENTTTTTANNNAQPASTTAQTTTTTSTTTNNTNNANQKKSKTFLQFLTEWFDKFQAKLTGIIESRQAKADQEFFNAHRQEILGKDFTKLQTSNVYNYESMQPYGQMQKDLNTISNRINTTTLQKINSDSDAQAVLNEVFANTVPKEIWSSSKVADAVTNYYKFGKTDNTQRISANGAVLKTIVTNAVDYCDGFYTNKIVEMRNTVETIKKNLEGVINTMVTESLCDIDFMSYVLEADDNNNGNNNQNNKPTTTSTDPNAGNNKNVSGNTEKINIINKNVTYYCSGIITAAFDRYKDNMAVLRSLVNTEQPNNNNNNNNNQNT